MQAVNLTDKFSKFTEHWRPKIVGELNGQEIKIVKYKGTFPWHHHEDIDELFLGWHGKFRIELRDRIIELNEGEFCIVPKGVEHRTMAENEAEVIIFEPVDTKNTGNIEDSRFTAPSNEKI